MGSARALFQRTAAFQRAPSTLFLNTSRHIPGTGSCAPARRDGELTFTLYPRLSITLADRLHAVLTSYQFTFAFFLLILPLTLLALPALLIFLLQRRSRRQP